MSPGLDDLEVKFTVHVMFHHDDRFPVNFTLQGRLTQDALSEWNYNAEITPQGQFGHFKLQQSMYDYLICVIKNLLRNLSLNTCKSCKQTRACTSLFSCFATLMGNIFPVFLTKGRLISN